MTHLAEMYDLAGGAAPLTWYERLWYAPGRGQTYLMCGLAGIGWVWLTEVVIPRYAHHRRRPMRNLSADDTDSRR